MTFALFFVVTIPRRTFTMISNKYTPWPHMKYVPNQEDIGPGTDPIAALLGQALSLKWKVCTLTVGKTNTIPIAEWCQTLRKRQRRSPSPSECESEAPSSIGSSMPVVTVTPPPTPTPTPPTPTPPPAPSAASASASPSSIENDNGVAGEN